MPPGLRGGGPVHHALVEIGRPQPPGATAEHDVVAVVHLRQVVERAGLLGEGQGVGPAVVGDGQPALFDVDVRGAVLAHRAQLDQVDRRIDLGDGPEQVEGADHVVHLGVDGVSAVQHGVRCGPLLAQVDDGVRLEPTQRAGDELGVGQVAGTGLDQLAGEPSPRVDPFRERGDRHQAAGAELGVVATADEIVDHRHLVTCSGKVQCGGPAEIAVATEDEYAHDQIPSWLHSCNEGRRYVPPMLARMGRRGLAEPESRPTLDVTPPPVLHREESTTHPLRPEHEGSTKRVLDPPPTGKNPPERFTGRARRHRASPRRPVRQTSRPATSGSPTASYSPSGSSSPSRTARQPRRRTDPTRQHIGLVPIHLLVLGQRVHGAPAFPRERPDQAGPDQARPNSGAEATSGAASSRTRRAAPSRPAYRLLC